MPRPKISFATVRSIFFFGLIAIFSVAMLYLIQPLFYPIFWAAVLAIMFFPQYDWLNTYLKMPALNALIMVVIVFVTIFLPLTLITALVVNETSTLYQSVSNTISVDTPLSTVLSHTPFANNAKMIQDTWNAQAPTLVKNIGSYIFNSISDLTQNSLHFLFTLLIMFYTLFFFFKDGEKILSRLMHFSPLGSKYEEMLYKRFTSTVRATLKGSTVIAVIQGTLGGILFWLTGVPGALMWGVLMAAICVIPAFGSFIIWLPAGLLMLAFGHLWQGITILAVGTFIISLVDNLLRPPLVGRDIQMHPLIVLFSTLGGIFLFGISGFIIGPVIASLYLAIMSIYDHYYRTELEDNY